MKKKMKILVECLAFVLALPVLAFAGDGPLPPWKTPKAPEDGKILKAAYKGDLTAVKAYLAKGGQPDLSNRYGIPLLSIAADQNHIEVMKALIQAGADVNAKADNPQPPLHLAAGHNYIPAMKLLIDAGANVNAQDYAGWTPLMWNCKNDQSTEEGFNLLLKAGADINVRADGKDSVLHFCARGRHQQIKQLIASKMDVNQRDFAGKTALHHVLFQGAEIRIRESRQEQESLIETVQALLKAGADVNAKDDDEETPLMAAAETPLTELADILLKAGADVKLTDNEGRTAFWIALREERPEMAQMLLKAGADPKARDKEGTTALMVACRYAFADIVQALIDAKVDVNLADEKGNTALIWAASADKAPWADSILGRMKSKSEFKKRQTEIVKMLIAAGADVNAKDTYGNTALDVAETSDVKSALKKAGAKAGK